MNSSKSKSTYPLAIGTNFFVNWDGDIEAIDGYFENGYFEGTLYSKEGQIGGWIIGNSTLASKNKKVILDSSGTITGATIVGGDINGTKITTTELYAGISNGY
jgi:hypothetical protein